MSRFINGGSSAGLINEKTGVTNKCPFLEDESTAKAIKKVSKEIQEDIIEPNYDTGYYILHFF